MSSASLRRPTGEPFLHLVHSRSVLFPAIRALFDRLTFLFLLHLVYKYHRSKHSGPLTPQQYISTLQTRLGISSTDLDEWYNVTVTDLSQIDDDYQDRSPLNFLSHYYGGSLYKALKLVYPNQDWKEWKFKTKPKHYWTDILVLRSVIDDLMANGNEERKGKAQTQATSTPDTHSIPEDVKTILQEASASNSLTTNDLLEIIYPEIENNRQNTSNNNSNPRSSNIPEEDILLWTNERAMVNGWIEKRGITSIDEIVSFLSLDEITKVPTHCIERYYLHHPTLST